MQIIVTKTQHKDRKLHCLLLTMFKFGPDRAMRSNSENLIEYVGYSYSHFLETICLHENKAETHDGAFSDEIIVKRCHVGREETV